MASESDSSAATGLPPSPPSPPSPPPPPVRVPDAVLAHFIGPGKPYEIGAATVDGITFRHFKNAPRNLAVFFSERFAKYANQEFLVYESERLTFAQVQQQADALALALLDRYAIQRGDRVAIAARNYPEWCISFIAIASIGAVSVPLNSWWMGEELEYGLQDSGTKLVIADIPRFYTAQAALRKLNIDAIVIDRQAPDTLKYKNRPLDATTVRFHQIIERNLNRTPLKLEPSTIAEPDDAAAIMYTSGTTGHPKGVVLTHRGIVNQLFVAEFGDAVQRVVNPAAVPSTQPCIICPIPLFHVTASHHIFLACFCSGRRLVLMYKWDVAQALQLIERERPTTWTGVPTMVGDLLAHPSFGKTDTSSLRVVGGGGAPTPPPQVKRTLAGFKGGAMPTQGYGLTETNGAVCQNTGENYINRPTSCGVPFPIVEAKVVDPSSGAELPVGSEGEIVFKSALVMRGYWNKPEATEQAIVSIGGDRGWFKTGDIAYIDADGFIHITDRAKDIIIRGGENIGCAEVEGVLYMHPSIHECAVFGLPDERLGEVPAMVALLKADYAAAHDALTTKRELFEFARQHLAHFKVPHIEHMFFAPGPLPRGATGKIHKRQIRAKVMEALKKAVPKAKL